MALTPRSSSSGVNGDRYTWEEHGSCREQDFSGPRGQFQYEQRIQYLTQQVSSLQAANSEKEEKYQLLQCSYHALMKRYHAAQRDFGLKFADLVRELKICQNEGLLYKARTTQLRMVVKILNEEKEAFELQLGEFVQRIAELEDRLRYHCQDEDGVVGPEEVFTLPHTKQKLQGTLVSDDGESFNLEDAFSYALHELPETPPVRAISLSPITEELGPAEASCRPSKGNPSFCQTQGGSWRTQQRLSSTALPQPSAFAPKQIISNTIIGTKPPSAPEPKILPSANKHPSEEATPLQSEIIGRQSRRSRPQVSYKEPSLKTKMRNPCVTK